jgi:hypothetical protein
MRRSWRRVPGRHRAAILAAAAVAFAAGPARAFTIESIVTRGCHEMITTDALRAARSTLATAAPLPATGDDQALIDDLPFSAAADMMDIGGATLLLGVRDNDLGGRDANDLSQLALLHGDPNLQQRHCLHGVDQPEPGGSQTALADCRAFILDGVASALDGLDASGSPDPTNRTTLRVYLAIRHGVDASLPTYYVRIGQAVHAVEDSFAHTFLTPDDTHVTAVVNWVNLVEGDLNEAVDGPPHSTELDRCDDPDDLRRARRMMATQAATELLQITLDPTQGRDQKMASVSALLDGWLAYQPGCSVENAWCAAPERKFGSINRTGCDVSGSRPSGWGALAAGVVALLGIAWRRRRSAAVVALALCAVAPGCMAATVAALPPSTATVAAPAPAPRSATAGSPTAAADPPTAAAGPPSVAADPPTAAAGSPTAAADPPTAAAGPPSVAADPPSPSATAAATAHVPPPQTTPVPEPGPWDRSRLAWGGYVGASGAFANAAAALELGVRARATTHWTFGLDAEWNPWIAVNGETHVRAGAFNGYGTVILRFPLAYETFNLRITGNLGITKTLMDLYGVPRGSTGLFVALMPLGVEWKASRICYVILNPLGFAAPIPQMDNIPFWYPQYRSSIAVEFYSR